MPKETGTWHDTTGRVTDEMAQAPDKAILTLCSAGARILACSI